MLKLSLFFMFLSLVASPVYLFPSGMPQPTDFMMVLAIFVTIVSALHYRADIGLSRLPSSLLALVIWIFLVSNSWAIIYSNHLFLMDALFWIYNLLVSSILINILIKREGAQKWVSFGILLSLAVSALGTVLGFHDLQGRNTGFFNNPNQLAYFSICAASSLVILNEFRISSISVIAGCTLGAVGILSSASLGGIAGSGFVILSLAVANITKFKQFLFVPIAATSLISAFIIIDDYSDNILSSNLEARFLRSFEKIDDVYLERNYDRIFLFPEYTILGAGSALHEQRFYPHGKNEIHSSFGVLLFNYGIFGLGLFLTYLFSVLHKANLQIWLISASPLIYSITHVGLRSTMFWVLFTIIMYKVKYSSWKKAP